MKDLNPPALDYMSNSSCLIYYKTSTIGTILHLPVKEEANACKGQHKQSRWL